MPDDACVSRRDKRAGDETVASGRVDNPRFIRLRKRRLVHRANRGRIFGALRPDSERRRHDRVSGRQVPSAVPSALASTTT